MAMPIRIAAYSISSTGAPAAGDPRRKFLLPTCLFTTSLAWRALVMPELGEQQNVL
jgi:hypothetical protein